MKKSKLLVLALAALSSVAIAATACDNANTPPNPTQNCEHVYEWKSDDNSHWEVCSECNDDKGNTAAHVDAKINDTGAAGEDGKCDVCDHAVKKTVTFDLNGHGENAPVPQNVGFGAKAAEPSAVHADGWTFSGWFTDSDCTGDAFDFGTDTVTSNITLYAKWTENSSGPVDPDPVDPDPDDPDPDNPDPDVPSEDGKSAATAYTLAKDAQSLNSFGASDELYFKFTAPTAGRYTIGLGSPATNSGKCRFTTDKDEDGTYYGNGCDAAAKYFDLAANETVIIILSCEVTLSDTAKVSPIVNDCTDEPLPADKFLSGMYSCESITIEIDREKGTVKQGNSTVSYTYEGGKTDTLYFTTSMNISGTIYSTAYELKYVRDGVYSLKVIGEKTLTYTVTYQEPQEPIDITKFTGKYTASSGYVTEVMIYESGNGYLMFNGNKNSFTSHIYDTETNTLAWGQYTINLKLGADGNAESITVKNPSFGTFILTYADVAGEELPSSLPIKSTDEYNGAIHTIKTAYDWQYLDESTLTIDGYDKSTGIYTISVTYPERNTYLLEIVDDNTIKLYNTSKVLLDTLEKYVAVYNDLPVSAATVTLNTSEFKKSLYHYKATAAGWYGFEFSGDLKIYYGMSEDKPADTSSAKQATSGGLVYLDAGDIVGIYIGSFASVPATVEFAVKVSDEAPKGLDEDSPLDLVNGSASISDMNNTSKYYFKFTAPSAGDYLVNVSYMDSYGNVGSDIHYMIGETAYGWDYTAFYGWGDWIAPMTSDFPYAQLHLDANEAIIIAADRIGDYYCQTASWVKVTVTKDYSKSATEIGVGSNDAGSLDSGIYKVSNLNDIQYSTGLKLTSATAFTVTCQGVTSTVTEITFDASQLALGFELAGSADYAVQYEVGTIKNPYVVNVTGLGKITVPRDYTYIKVVAGADFDIALGGGSNPYKQTSGDMCYFYIDYNGEKYGYNQTGSTTYELYDKTLLSVAKGESVIITLGCDYYYYYDYSFVVYYDYSTGATDAEFAKGEPSDGKLPFTAECNVANGDRLHISQSIDVTVTGDSAFSLLLNDGSSLTATSSNGKYIVTLKSPSDLYVEVSTGSAQTLVLTALFGQGTEVYPYDIVLTDGKYTWKGTSATTYFTFTADGIFTVSGSSLKLNGKAVASGSVTVKAGDVISCTSSLTVSIAVPDDYIGKYAYTDGGDDKTLFITETSVITGGDKYSLISIVGDVYTFTNTDGGSIAITLSADGTSVGGNALTPTDVFTDEQATTYEGEAKEYYGSAVMLTLEKNGAATYAFVNNGRPISFDVFVLETADGKYTFSYDYSGTYTVTFYWDDDGVLHLSDDAIGDVTFGGGYEGEVTGVTYVGYYSDMSADVSLTIDLDTNSVVYSINDGDEVTSTTCEINDGVYEFVAESGDNVSFTISEDIIEITDEYYGTTTLTKQS